MAIDKDTLQGACNCMESLLDQFRVMNWSATARVPDYAGFKLTIRKEKP